jgi:hypothetical protein
MVTFDTALQMLFSKLLEPKWRDLARMALDYLTIPAMSPEPERVLAVRRSRYLTAGIGWMTMLSKL